MRALATVTLVVADYDEAIAYFVQQLGFRLIEDTPLSGGKRWVVVSPSPRSAQVLLAKASDEEQKSRVGNQTGGRVAFFLETDNIAAEYAAMAQRGVRFLEMPRQEDFGTVAVFVDLYGNKWDLIERW